MRGRKRSSTRKRSRSKGSRMGEEGSEEAVER